MTMLEQNEANFVWAVADYSLAVIATETAKRGASYGDPVVVAAQAAEAAAYRVVLEFGAPELAARMDASDEMRLSRVIGRNGINAVEATMALVNAAVTR